MANRRRTALLCALALVAIAVPAARASHAPALTRLDLGALRRAVERSGAVSPPMTQQRRAGYDTCGSTGWASGTDGTPLDVASYGVAFDCVGPDAWLYVVSTYDDWTPPELDYIGIGLNTDDNASTGCGGADYFAVGFYDPEVDDFVGGVFRTLTCSMSDVALVADAYVAKPDSDVLGIEFDNSAIGSPTRLRFKGELAAMADAQIEHFPTSGSHLLDGYADDECAFASRGYYTQSDDSTAVATALRSAGATGVEVHGGGVVSFDTSSARDAARALAVVDPAAVVERNAVHRRSAEPIDYLYHDQWDLAQVHAPQAWDVTRGSADVVVAVIDSGVDAPHGQLTRKLVPGYNAVTGGGLGSDNSDEGGHGTAVAGVVGALTDDGSNVASLGWHTRVMAVKDGDADGSLQADLVEGMRWAVDHGARVINVSSGSCFSSQLLQDAVDYAESHGVLVVASAGNSGPGAGPEYPAAFPNVLAVGATGRDGAIASYSSTGSYVDLVAPGGSGDGNPSHGMLLLLAGGTYTQHSGTSFSSPMVAAAAALVFARVPSASPATVRSLLTSTSADLGAPGRDDVYGAGLLDAAAAVTAAAPAATSAPTAEPTPEATATAAPTASAIPSPSSSATSSASATPAASPTTATSSPSPSQDASRVTLDAPATAVSGVQVIVSGLAAPGAQVELWGVTAPNGTITRVNTPTVTADPAGRWSKSIRPLRNVTLQARVGGATSNTRFVAVATAVKDTVSPLAGCVVQVSGSVFEPKPGAIVYVRAIDASGRTVSLGDGRVQNDGRFLLRRTWVCGATLSVYAVISGDNVNRPGGSPAQRVATRR